MRRDVMMHLCGIITISMWSVKITHMTPVEFEKAGILMHSVLAGKISCMCSYTCCV